MRLRDFSLSDYRLAAYVVITAVIAGTVAFTVDRLTAPNVKVEANGAPTVVRQIPIARTSAATKSADLGDPEGKLTPIYPTSPGKDLPIKDTPIIQVTKPAAAATTTGSASATAPVATAAAPQAAATPQANACNVTACAAAYRSFRESDCSYQPVVGARRACEGAPGLGQGLGGQSSTGQVAAQPPARPQTQPQTQPMPQQSRAPFDPRTTIVRGLPPPPRQFDDDDDDDRGPVMREAPERRYDLRRNWVSEPQE